MTPASIKIQEDVFKLERRARMAIHRDEATNARQLLNQILEIDQKHEMAHVLLFDIALQGWNPRFWNFSEAEYHLDALRRHHSLSRRILSRAQLLKERRQMAAALEKSIPFYPQWEDSHKGERCVIVGNGPSLKKMNLSFLRKEKWIGTNRIYLGFQQWNIYCTYYLAVNRHVIEQCHQDIQNLACPRFLNFEGAPYLQQQEQLLFINSREGKDFFGTHLADGLTTGATVTYVALQLAYIMGFTTVILIGVDHSYPEQPEQTPHKLVEARGPDLNHFSPDYFSNGMKWQLPDLERSEKHYRLADTYYRAAGRSVIDATIDGKCPVFQKADYRALFHL